MCSEIDRLVSIHAPARGATQFNLQSRDRLKRFNPRAREGRDTITSLVQQRQCCFNPRAREGRDHSDQVQLQGWQVSIHAPARGATCRLQIYASYRPCFNPRAREGRDYYAACKIIKLPKFQSTRPRGARRNSFGSGMQPISFNPRAREGRDTHHLFDRAIAASFNPRAREGRDLCTEYLTA